MCAFLSHRTKQINNDVKNKTELDLVFHMFEKPKCVTNTSKIDFI